MVNGALQYVVWETFKIQLDKKKKENIQFQITWFIKYMNNVSIVIIIIVMIKLI